MMLCVLLIIMFVLLNLINRCESFKSQKFLKNDGIVEICKANFWYQQVIHLV